MVRDPFYRQIVAGLEASVDGDLFEACAADLLREVYPGLVPVQGGSDAGMDGAVADTDGEPFPLVSTTGKDAIGNLTRSLRSYLKNDGHRRVAVLATSQNLTPQRKKNLFNRARELGFTLLQIHDQMDMAYRLYRSPRWCLDLLNLTGAPYAISAVPRTQRLLLTHQPIGRGSDMAWLRDTEGDRLLVGQPGSGKTFLFQTLVREELALFAVSEVESQGVCK